MPRFFYENLLIVLTLAISKIWLRVADEQRSRKARDLAKKERDKLKGPKQNKQNRKHKHNFYPDKKFQRTCFSSQRMAIEVSLTNLRFCGYDLSFSLPHLLDLKVAYSSVFCPWQVNLLQQQK